MCDIAKGVRKWDLLQPLLCQKLPRFTFSKGRLIKTEIRTTKMTQEADLVRVEFHDDNDGSVTIVNVPAGTKITEAASKVRRLIGNFVILQFLILTKNVLPA